MLFNLLFLLFDLDYKKKKKLVGECPFLSRIHFNVSIGTLKKKKVISNFRKTINNM